MMQTFSGKLGRRLYYVPGLSFPGKSPSAHITEDGHDMTLSIYPHMDSVKIATPRLRPHHTPPSASAFPFAFAFGPYGWLQQ